MEKKKGGDDEVTVVGKGTCKEGEGGTPEVLSQENGVFKRESSTKVRVLLLSLRRHDESMPGWFCRTGLVPA